MPLSRQNFCHTYQADKATGMGFRSAIYRLTFDVLVVLGRPFGGLRPRRITHWLAKRAFPVFDPRRTKWTTDSGGCKFLLNPYFFIDYHLLAFGEFEPAVKRCLSNFVKPGMVCFDVGANIGTMAIPMAFNSSPGGHVYAFEPVKHLSQRLQGNISANLLDGAITVAPVALGDKSRTVQLRHVNWDIRNHGTATLAEINCGNGPGLNVPVVSADEYVDAVGLSRLDVIKLDIQGAEMAFLEGAACTIARYRPIMVVEFSPDDLHRFGTTPMDLWDAITRMDYDIRIISSLGTASRQLMRANVGPDFESSAVLCVPRSPSNFQSR